jgi:uncharacterized protein YceK
VLPRCDTTTMGMDIRIIALVIALILGGCASVMIFVSGTSHSAITVSHVQAHTGASHE